MKRHIEEKNAKGIMQMMFFHRHNFFLALFGSLATALPWAFNNKIFNLLSNLDINKIYLLFFSGGILFFLLLAILSYVNGVSPRGSARLAGRRGLFTFSIMALVVILTLIISGRIYLEQEFYYFLRYFLSGMIITAFLAVPLDYGIDFFFWKKK